MQGFFREVVDTVKKILYFCRPFRKNIILKRYAVRKKA